MAPTEIVLCFLKSWEQIRNPGALFGIIAAIAERPENFKVKHHVNGERFHSRVPTTLSIIVSPVQTFKGDGLQAQNEFINLRGIIST